MSEQNKAVIRHFFEVVWKKGNLSAIDEIVAPNYIDHDPSNPGIRGQDGVRHS